MGAVAALIQLPAVQISPSTLFSNLLIFSLLAEQEKSKAAHILCMNVSLGQEVKGDLLKQIQTVKKKHTEPFAIP